MKSKKLIALICVLAFITVLIVLNSTLFTLQHISVNWMTTKYKLEVMQDKDLIKSVPLGDSIFLLNKEEIKNRLEKDNSYLRVVGIETKFPNKIVIHSAERETLYAVQITSNEYAVIDELGKVLELSTSGEVFAGSALGAKPIKVTFKNFSLNPKDYEVGEEIKDENAKALLVRLAKTLKESNYNQTASKGVFSGIDVELTGSGYDINMSTRNGMKICLKDAKQMTTEKLLLGLECYNLLQQESVVSGSVIVEYNNEMQECKAHYINN